MRSAQARVTGVGVDNHLDTEPVYNEAGAVIAHRCRNCTLITCHVGVCDGCGKSDVKLTHHVERKKKRYCTPDCYRATTAEARREARALEELARKKKPRSQVRA